MKTVNIIVNKINYTKDDYCILDVSPVGVSKKSLGLRKMIAKGPFINPMEDDTFKVTGDWIVDPIYGKQFDVVSSTRIMPVTNKAILKFLVKHIKGLGKKSALDIVKKYGIDTLNSLKNGTCEIEGISKTRMDAIIAQYKKHEEYETILTELLLLHIPLMLANKLYDKHGSNALQKVKQNPYIALPFADADKYCKAHNRQVNYTYRVQQMILNVIELLSNFKGHVFVHQDDVLKEVKNYNNKTEYKNDILMDNDIENAIKELLDDKTLYKDTDKIYVTAKWYQESFVAKRLKELLENKNVMPIADYTNIHNYLTNYDIKLDGNQEKAVHTVVNNAVTIVTGGPGTGKTQTINAILDVIKTFKPSATIEMAAPTGKAARRMESMTGHNAQTLHKLLGITGDDDIDANADIKTIDADFVFVDETSMMDLQLAYQLLKAVGDDTKLIFVGDVDQLPSVGSGAVLSDMIDSQVIPTIRLTKIYRQGAGSTIIKNAHAVIKNEMDNYDDKNTTDSFYTINIANQKQMQLTIMASIKRMIDTKRFGIDDIQVLLPTKFGECGTHKINQLIQDFANPSTDKTLEYTLNGMTYRVDDRVMQMVNNNDKQIYNGEVGIVANIYKNEENGKMTIEVEYESDVIEYEGEEIEEIELAYATTIHKSQGSEYPLVILGLTSDNDLMLNRNLVYTGITRASKTVITVTDANCIKKAASIEPSKRNSQLALKLQSK